MLASGRVLFGFLIAVVLSACGGGGGGDGGGASAPTATSPSGLSYPSPQSLTIGTNVTLTSSVTGTVTGYGVTPALPAGLALNSTTGTISGVPTVVTGQQTYTVTASNGAGSTRFGVSIVVRNARPMNFSYASPQAIFVSTTFRLTPTIFGLALTYTVTPALPAGLTLDAGNGTISGIPTTATPQRTYTVTATNDGGSATFDLALTINGAPSGLVYTPAVVNLPVGTTLTPLVPAVNGVVTTWTVTPALPKGLTLASDGKLSGAPRESRSATNYTVMAANVSGFTTTTVNLTVTTTMPLPAATGYTSFDNTPLTLYAWEGRNIVMLTRNSTLNPGFMQLWLEALDRGWDFYKLATGRDPVLYRQYNGKGTMADVPTTCGAGCGYLGYTGIEAQSSYFDIQLSRALNNGAFGGFLFYEMGRNFWFYGPEAEYKPPLDSRGVVTGYAVLMQWWSMDAAGVHIDADEFFPSAEAARAHLEGVVDLYVQDTTLTWDNTLGQNKGVGDVDAPGLFTSILMRARRDFGGADFDRKFWREVDARPDATTTPQAIDNVVLAACATAQKNLTRHFNQVWRWPVSDAAKQEAQTRFGNPL